MRILLTAALPPYPSGGSLSRTQIFQGLAARGHEVYAISATSIEALEQGDVYAAENPWLRVVRYLAPHTEFGLLNAKRHPAEVEAQESQILERLLAKAADSFRPDLIVIGRERSAPSFVPVAKRLGLPVVLMIRGIPTCYMFDNSYPSCLSDQLSESFQHADLLLTAAEHLTTGLRSRGSTNVKTIANAIDLHQFRPQPPPPDLRRRLKLADDAKVVLVPATLHKRKRPFDVVEAAAAQPDRSSLVWVMAGSGELEDEVKARCRELGVAARFRFLGWVDYSEMPDLMRLADLVVMASEGEGMSRASIEAMACGKCLVASDIAPSKELISDRDNGLLFQTKSSGDLAERVQEAVDSPELRKRLGNAAHLSVQDRSIERATEAYEEEFLALLRSPVAHTSSRA